MTQKSDLTCSTARSKELGGGRMDIATCRHLSECDASQINGTYETHGTYGSVTLVP
jgi:hypothetical protein